MSMLTPLAPPPLESCDRMLPKGTAIMAGSGASGGMKPAERAHLAKQHWSFTDLWRAAAPTVRAAAPLLLSCNPQLLC